MNEYTPLEEMRDDLVYRPDSLSDYEIKCVLIALLNKAISKEEKNERRKP